MSKIADLELLQRPREKALLNGIHSLSNIELRAIIIRCGTRQCSALELAQVVLNEYGTLNNLIATDMYELMKIKGIKKAKALELSAIIELIKRVSREDKNHLLPINNSQLAYELAKDELKDDRQEKFMIIFLNIKLNVIKKEILFVGGEHSSLIDVNLIFKKALACGAKKIICLHNHPSGNPIPSNEDIAITSKIRNIGELINIELLDHIIVGDGDYFSFSHHKI